MRHALPQSALTNSSSNVTRDLSALHMNALRPVTVRLAASATGSCLVHTAAGKAFRSCCNRLERLQPCSSSSTVSTEWPSQQTRSPTCMLLGRSSNNTQICTSLSTRNSSRSNVTACASAPLSHVSTANSSSTVAPSAAAVDLGKLLSSPDQGQQISGLAELVRQQQAAISGLQQEMLQLRALAGRLQESAAPASSAAVQDAAPAIATNGSSPASTPASSPAGTASPLLNPQHQQQLQQLAYGGSYKAMTLEDFRALPDKIILVRHAESQGNVDARIYSTTPDYEVPLSARGWEQAVACGEDIRLLMQAEHGPSYKLFFMTSPYCRTRQTFVGLRQAFPDRNFAGVQEEVQLREQDFGNFQNPDKIKADLAERNRFGRFYYRFPGGESGSDVYNRVSIFEDHLIRDMKAGRFSQSTSLCLVTHGLTMRVFLMRWFNWTVESFLQVYNPPNAKAIVVDKMGEAEFIAKTSKLRERRQTLQVKNAYRLRKDSMARLKMETADATKSMDQGLFEGV